MMRVRLCFAISLIAAIAICGLIMRALHVRRLRSASLIARAALLKGNGTALFLSGRPDKSKAPQAPPGPRTRRAGDPYVAEKARVEAWVRVGNGTLLFMHVHKGGGSTVCSMARASGMRIPTPETSGGWMGKNCNPRKRDKYRSWQARPDDMVAYARTHRPEPVQFYAIEVGFESSAA